MPEVGKPGKTPCHRERQSPPRGLCVTMVPQGPHEKHSSASFSSWCPRRGLSPAQQSHCVLLAEPLARGRLPSSFLEHSLDRDPWQPPASSRCRRTARYCCGRAGCCLPGAVVKPPAGRRNQCQAAELPATAHLCRSSALGAGKHHVPLRTAGTSPAREAASRTRI